MVTASGQRRAAARPVEQNYRLTLAYDGTAYGGWQRQPQVMTVQQRLEEALAKIVGTAARVHGSGRTDAGVHARGQVASVRVRTPLTPAALQRALNANLPADIRVMRLARAAADFHARFSARWKEYRYRIDTGAVADPFARAYAWHRPGRLDVAAMRRAARELVGRRDFSALAAKSEREPVRRVRTVAIRQRGRWLEIVVVADGFLYKMARGLVGALVKVGEGRLSVAQLRAIVAGRRRPAIIETAPARGLCLWRVWY
jgi:tRNA pseudouridine38-40 synthase